MVKLNKKTREQYTKFVLDALHGREKEKLRNTFLELHPSDRLDIFVTLNADERTRVYSYLTAKEFAEIFGFLKITNQKLLFLEHDTYYAVAMFNTMFTYKVVTFLLKHS